MKINIKEIYYNLRKQPVVSVVSIIGTALAIFLVMVTVMLSEVKTADIAPEVNRSRSLDYSEMRTQKITDEYSNRGGCMSYQSYRAIFSSMTVPEAVTAYVVQGVESVASEHGDHPVGISLRQVDDMYWKIFEFDFIAGHPFDKAAFDAGMQVAVITENTARAIFGDINVVGREFSLCHTPYRVTGVIKDVSPLTFRTYGNVFVPFTATDMGKSNWGEGIMGPLVVTVLAKSKDDFNKIRAEYSSNIARYNKELEPTGWKLKIEDDIHKNGYEEGNMGNDDNTARYRRWVVYAILLLVPAINISSMTESRLLRRASEIGVRRAFGCTRMEIMFMVLAENLVITLFAGAIGWMLSVVFALISQDFLFDITTSGTVDAVSVDVSSLMHWSTFFYALLFCFILNLLSSGIPAYRASRLNIVNAISGLRK